jgi:hypothetical protein
MWLLTPCFEIMRRTTGRGGIRANSRRFLRNASRIAGFRALFFVLDGWSGSSSSRAFCVMTSEEGSGRFRHLGINWSDDHCGAASA